MRTHEKGFSLIELMGALFILAVGLPAIAYTFGIGVKTDSISNDGVQAHFLATSLINEISQRRFRESAANPAGGPALSEISDFDRRNFDDVSDYEIFEDTWGEISPPRDETGAQLTAFSKFSQYVLVRNVAAPGANGATRSFASVSEGSTDFKLVTVTISWDGGRKKVTQNKVFVLTP